MSRPADVVLNRTPPTGGLAPALYATRSTSLASLVGRASAVGFRDPRDLSFVPRRARARDRFHRSGLPRCASALATLGSSRSRLRPTGVGRSSQLAQYCGTPATVPEARAAGPPGTAVRWAVEDAGSAGERWAGGDHGCWPLVHAMLGRFEPNQTAAGLLMPPPPRPRPLPGQAGLQSSSLHARMRGPAATQNQLEQEAKRCLALKVERLVDDQREPQLPALGKWILGATIGIQSLERKAVEAKRKPRSKPHVTQTHAEGSRRGWAGHGYRVRQLR